MSPGDADASNSDAGTPGPDASMAVCGDGVIAPDEECDDGNATDGDGCSAACLADHACLVTHNGGSPASISSLSMTPDGQFSQVRTLNLAGADGTAASSGMSRFSGLTACNRHLYAVLDADGMIAHIQIAADGSLAAGALTPHDNIYGLECDQTRGILFAATGERTLASTTITTYLVGQDGSLTQADAMPLVFGAGGDMPRVVHLVPHPVTGDLWVIAYASDVLGGLGGATSYRIAADDGGALSLVEGPADIGAFDIGFETRIRGDGALLFMAGLSGGGTGVWDLPNDNTLPDADLRITQCSPGCPGAFRLAARQQSNVFYQATSGGDLLVTEVDLAGSTMLLRETMTLNGGRHVLSLGYDDTMLTAVDPASGEITAFQVASDEITLTPSATASVPGGAVHDSVFVRCTQ